MKDFPTFDPMMRHLISSWEQLGKDDPLWAILIAEEKARGRWNPAEFFATGVADVDHIWQRLSELNALPAPTRALDFGCGVGRLTRPLATRFAAVDGVDVSSTMLAKAMELGAVPPHVRFVHNPRPDLSTLDQHRYSFVLSLISLQHVPQKIALGYLSDICRLLAPGGVAYLQMFTFLDVTKPSAVAKLARDESFTNQLYRRIKKAFSRIPPRMDTHYCRLSEILRVVESHRLEVVAVTLEPPAPPPFVSHVLVLRKPSPRS